MNIENLYSMLSSLRQFTNLLKQDMGLETLNAIRELKGFEVLENYEKMFEVDGVGTKNAIRNYIVNEINSLTTGVLEVSKYDNAELKSFVSDTFKVPEVDSKKIKYIADVIEDPEALSLVSHKLSINEYLSSLVSDSKYIGYGKTDDDLKIKLEDIKEKYDALLKVVEKSLNNDSIIIIDVQDGIYGFGVDKTPEMFELKDYIVLLNKDLKALTGKLESSVKDIKENIVSIDYDVKLANNLKENFMKTVDEYCKGIISEEVYLHLSKQQIDVIEFYSKIILSYISSTVNFIEYISNYIEKINNIDNAIEISYKLFVKSE